MKKKRMANWFSELLFNRPADCSSPTFTMHSLFLLADSYKEKYLWVAGEVRVSFITNSFSLGHINFINRLSCCPCLSPLFQYAETYFDYRYVFGYDVYGKDVLLSR